MACRSNNKAADYRMRKHYGITLDEYNQVFEHQCKRCAICKQPVLKGQPRLAIDHRHSDGLLRGLLCWKCNRAIGAFHRFHPNTIELFQRAAEYLSKPPITAVFKVARYTAPGKVGSKKRAKLLKAMESNSTKGEHAKEARKLCRK